MDQNVLSFEMSLFEAMNDPLSRISADTRELREYISQEFWGLVELHLI